MSVFVWLQVAKYGMETSEIVLTVQLANREALVECGSTNHTCTLVVGDEDNRTIYKQRIMWVGSAVWSVMKVTVHKVRLKYLIYTHPKWKLYTYIMGFTMHEKQTPITPNAENGIESFVSVLNLSVGEWLYKNNSDLRSWIQLYMLCNTKGRN